MLIDAQAEQIAALKETVARLERRLGQDSSTSSRPPSSDNPHRKGRAKSSTRRASGKRPGKQPGTGGTSLRLVETLDETIECRPVACPRGMIWPGRSR